MVPLVHGARLKAGCSDQDLGEDQRGEYEPVASGLATSQLGGRGGVVSRSGITYLERNCRDM
jgi:hypothetical protein